MSFTLEEKQGFVMGLIQGCPFPQALPACPAKELRRMSLGQQLAALKELSETALDAIIEYHKQCQKTR
ncbi:MAG: hypothetical protein ABII75_08010 [Candidatus Omnitrophota bacterium]